MKMSTAAAKRYLYSHFNTDQTKIGSPSLSSSSSPPIPLLTKSALSPFISQQPSKLIIPASNNHNSSNSIISSSVTEVEIPSSSTSATEDSDDNYEVPLITTTSRSSIQSSAFSIPINIHRNTATSSLLLSPSSLLSTLRINSLQPKTKPKTSGIFSGLLLATSNRKRSSSFMLDDDDDEEDDLEKELMLDAHVPVISETSGSASSSTNKTNPVSFGSGSNAAVQSGNVFVPVLSPQQEIFEKQQQQLALPKTTTISAINFNNNYNNTTSVNGAVLLNVNSEETPTSTTTATTPTQPIINLNNNKTPLESERIELSPFSSLDEGIDDMEDIMIIDPDSSPTQQPISTILSATSTTTISTSTSSPAPTTSKAKVRRTLYQCTWRGCNFQCLQCHIIEQHVRVIHLGRSSSSSSLSSSPPGGAGSAGPQCDTTTIVDTTPNSTVATPTKPLITNGHHQPRRLRLHRNPHASKFKNNHNKDQDTHNDVDPELSSTVVVVVEEDDDDDEEDDDESDREEEFYYNELEIIDDHYSPTLSLKSSSAVSSLSSPIPMSPPTSMSTNGTVTTTSSGQTNSAPVTNSNHRSILFYSSSSTTLQPTVEFNNQNNNQQKTMINDQDMVKNIQMDIDEDNNKAQPNKSSPIIDSIGLSNGLSESLSLKSSTRISDSVPSNSHIGVISQLVNYHLGNGSNRNHPLFSTTSLHQPQLLGNRGNEECSTRVNVASTTTNITTPMHNQDLPIDLSPRSKLNSIQLNTIGLSKLNSTTSSTSSLPTLTSTLTLNGAETITTSIIKSSTFSSSTSANSQQLQCSTGQIFSKPSLVSSPPTQSSFSILPSKSMIIPIPMVPSSVTHNQNQHQSATTNKLFPFQSSLVVNGVNGVNVGNLGNGNGSISTSPFSSASSSSSSAYYSSSPTSSTKSWTAQLDDHPILDHQIQHQQGLAPPPQPLPVANHHHHNHNHNHSHHHHLLSSHHPHSPLMMADQIRSNLALCPLPERIKNLTTINDVASVSSSTTTSTSTFTSSSSSAIFSLPNSTIFNSINGLSSSISRPSNSNSGLTNLASTNQNSQNSDGAATATSTTFNSHNQLINNRAQLIMNHSNVIKFGARSGITTSITPSCISSSTNLATPITTTSTNTVTESPSLFPNSGNNRISLDIHSSHLHPHPHHHAHGHAHTHHHHSHQSPAAAALAALNRHLSLQSQHEKFQQLQQQQHQANNALAQQKTSSSGSVVASSQSNNNGIPTVPRRRGRPPGSTNKKKKLMLEQQQQAAAQQAAAQQQFLMSLGIPPSATGATASSIIASIAPNSAAAAAAAAALLKQHLHKANHHLDQAQIDKMIVMGGVNFGGSVNNHHNNSNNHSSGTGRRPRGESRKCRKVYGMDHRELWCTQCKWKKACSRFTD